MEHPNDICGRCFYPRFSCTCDEFTELVSGADRAITFGFEGWPEQDDSITYTCPYCNRESAGVNVLFQRNPMSVHTRFECDNCEAHDEWERVY